jgi:MFS family permease
MIVTFVMQAFCLVACATLGHVSATWFVVCLVAVYFTWGQIYSLFPSMSGDYFGTRHATSNYAVLYTAKGVASIIGAYVAALLYERSGSWAMGFYGSAAMALIAAGLAYALHNLASTARAKAKIPLTA